MCKHVGQGKHVQIGIVFEFDSTATWRFYHHIENRGVGVLSKRWECDQISLGHGLYAMNVPQAGQWRRAGTALRSPELLMLHQANS